MQSFYHTLKKPIIGLAPMDGVSDAAFRYIHTAVPETKPDVVYTEFVSAEGIIRGADRLFVDFLWHNNGVPVVAQIFGDRPQAFFEAAQIVCELGFAGIDINMGCPCRTVTAKGGGAALICTPDTAVEILKKTKQGVDFWYENGLVPNSDFLTPELIEKVGKFKSNLNIAKKIKEKIPVTVKTRMGYDKPIPTEWAKKLLEAEPVVITMHGRTLKQMYTGQANWEALAAAADYIHQNSPTLFLANGDVVDADSAYKCLNITKADGLLVGRATFGNPWCIPNIIDTIRHHKLAFVPPMPLILDTMAMHAEYFLRTKPEKSFHQMRKHMAWYVHGIPNSSQLRSRLVRINNMTDLMQILKKTAFLG